MDIFKLIDCMRVRAPLWNRQSPLYTARSTKKQLWSEVAALTGATEDEARRKWKCLNDIFRREHNKYALRQQKHDVAEPPQWKYYYPMQFLQPQIGTRYCMQSRRASPAAAAELRHDDSVDGSLDGFEADATIKSEASDVNSDFAEEEEDEVLRQLEVCDFDCVAAVAPTAKRAKLGSDDGLQSSPAEDRAEKSANVAASATTDSNANNKSTTTPSSGAADGTTCRCGSEAKFAGRLQQHVEDAMARRLLAAEQHRFDDCRGTLQPPSHADDDDYHFALSLVPTMRSLPPRRKMTLRMKVQKLLCDAIEDATAAVVDSNNDDV